MRSVQLHLASRGRSEGTGAGPGLTAPHSHTHGTSTRDVLSIHDLGGKFLRQAVGLAWCVTGGRKPVTVSACVPLVSVVSIVMSHVLRRDNMRTGRGVTHHQHQAAAGRRGPGNWEKVIFRNCNRRLRVPLIFFHLYLQQTNLQLQKVIGVKVCDVEIFLAPLHNDVVEAGGGRYMMKTSRKHNFPLIKNNLRPYFYFLPVRVSNILRFWFVCSFIEFCLLCFYNPFFRVLCCLQNKLYLAWCR